MPDHTENKGFHVIIAAAGSGARFGSEIPKQYYSLAGKALLTRTVRNVLDWEGLLSLSVIINPDHIEHYNAATHGLKIDHCVNGGKERSHSINNALENLSHLKNEDIILIHDAARPFTKPQDIASLLTTMNDNRAATLAVRVSDTLRRADNSHAAEIVDRDGLWAIQTPQAFRFGDLKSAHTNAKNSAYTDDTSLISEAGIDVALVEGSPTNFKITTQDDWNMALALINQNTRTTSGTGFDVHAFESAPSGKPLIICGVEIEHDRALTGHSDADVALHAITDALLGAIGMGDIGTHFPPSDETFKDMDSAIFLKKTLQMINDKNGEIQNIDLTIICEAPKIGPHRDAMIKRLSEITDLPASHLNIKATTTEKLGFTGRGEGIAAQAIATVKLPVE